jgi:hypothetical protein
VPELFLGLLSLAVAVVLTAHTVSGTIHDVRRTRDVISITASARVPIASDLVKWSIVVSASAPTEARAARILGGDTVATVAYLRHAGLGAGAVHPGVVQSETIVTRLPHNRTRTRYRIWQRYDMTTTHIDLVEAASTGLAALIEHGIDVSAEPLEYISTDLEDAKIEALGKATGEARRRADILVKGLGGKLGPMRSSSLGVYQITPRFSTDVSDYGINDTSTRDKDVTAVVTATFTVKTR